MKISKLLFIVVVGSMVIAACGGGATPTADTSNVPVVADDFSVVAVGL